MDDSTDMDTIEDRNSKENLTNNPTIDADSLSNTDLIKLSKILRDTQCPLVPKNYESNGEQVSAYYFNNNLWTIDSNDKARILNCQDDKKKIRAIDTAEIMLAIDKYVNNVRINKSNEIYNKLKHANDTEYTKDNPYEKLMPTLTTKIMFLTVVITGLLNGYFTFRGLYDALENEFEFQLWIMQLLCITVYSFEAILFINMAFKGLLYHLIKLFFKKYINYTVHKETKIIAFEARDLTSLSILRYMPSLEMLTTYFLQYSESLSKFWIGLRLKCEDKNPLFALFDSLVYIAEHFSPFLAIFALFIKMRALDFVVLNTVVDWDYNDILYFAAFVNQVSGIRVIKDIQIESLQHFVFSGSDASLGTNELLLQSKWWDSTIVSAVSNLNFSTYELIVFWYQLDPLKIQLLLKNHIDDEDVWQLYKKTDNLLYDYDEMVLKKLKLPYDNIV